MSWNTISELKRTAIKPQLWIVQSMLNSYVLLFSFDNPPRFDMYPPFEVRNSRGKTKAYKTIEAALKDVYQVDSAAEVVVKPLNV